MPSYDAANFDPPAPVAVVTLRHPESRRSISDQVLLMDTGADVTLLPRLAVERIGVQPLTDPPYELMGFDGSRSVAPAAIVDMVFVNRAFRGRYLLIDGEVGVLGRDVLNHLQLLLNGPARQWSEQA